MARVVKLQPWGNQLPVTLTVILSHLGGRLRRGSPDRSCLPKRLGAARWVGSALTSVLLLGTPDQRSLPGPLSLQRLLSHERGTSFVINDIEGTR